MQFDFSLNANSAQQLDVKGKFFKLVSSTGKVRVRTNTGDSIDLMPGQGVSNVDFQWLSVMDRSGAANIGVLLAGEFDFTDDRISGQVEVIDGSRTRTLAGSMFASSPYCGAQASTYSNIQLWNPANSGKNVIVGAMDFGTTAAAAINVLASNVMLANVYGAAVGNKRMGAAAGVAQARWENKAATETFPFGCMRNEATTANMPQPWAIQGAIVVPPGWGLNVYCPTQGITSTANFEWYEENVT